MAKAKILVVEDEGIVARDIGNNLEALGYEVVGVVSSGDEALKKVEETKPDLVLMDILLEGHLNGIEVAERIKGRYGTPIVYLTAYADDKTVHKAKLTRPAGYVLKPFGERELRAVIETALHNLEVKNGLRDKIVELEKLREKSIEQEEIIGNLKEEVNELLMGLGEGARY